MSQIVNHTNILNVLDQIINETTSHIHDFTNSRHDFTRKRKLSASTVIKTILNMRSNSLNAELFDAFPEPNKQVSVSAFEQQKAKLTPACFEYIFHQFNRQTNNQQLLNHQYHVLAIDGFDLAYPGTQIQIIFVTFQNINLIVKCMLMPYMIC
ncbi:transposase [Limosilactobacillus reuteri]|uniref:transposase n=1 Tax=Limosilactobacillus reuteri TaxID=1598 RepID=UPI00214ABC31|nr:MULTISPECIES: transposase [Limosilactobacillus]MCR1878787.1 transposase [Limosilactobacillus reuteri]